jgi:hypothetical protein
MNPANSELVLAAWIAGLPGFTGAMVGTSLPQDTAAWAANGFVRVGPVVGGNLIGDQGSVRNPVVQVSCYAVPVSASTSSTGTRSPWGQAATLAERVRAGCYDEPNIRRALNLGPKFRGAYVADIEPETEPSRTDLEDPPIARYDLDLSVIWAEIPE